MSTTPLLNDSTLSSAPYVDPLRERRKKNIAFLAFLTFLSILGYISATEDGGLRSESIIDQSHKLSFNDQPDSNAHQDASRYPFNPTLKAQGEGDVSLESRLKYLGGIFSQSIGYTVNEDGAKERKALFGIRTASSTNAVFSSWSESSVYVEVSFNFVDHMISSFTRSFAGNELASSIPTIDVWTSSTERTLRRITITHYCLFIFGFLWLRRFKEALLGWLHASQELDRTFSKRSLSFQPKGSIC
jgi:hypothetical protein